MEQPKKKQKTDCSLGFDDQLAQLEREQRDLKIQMEELETMQAQMRHQQRQSEHKKLMLTNDRWRKSWHLIIKYQRSGSTSHHIIFDSYDEMIRTSDKFCSKLVLLKTEWQTQFLNVLKTRHAISPPPSFNDDILFYYLTRLCIILKIGLFNPDKRIHLSLLSNDICHLLSGVDCITQELDTQMNDVVLNMRDRYVSKQKGINGPSNPQIPEMLVHVGYFFPIIVEYSRTEHYPNCDIVFVKDNIDFGDKDLLSFSFISNEEKRKAVKDLLALAEAKVNKMMIACEHRFGTNRENILKRLPNDVMKLVISYL